MAADAAACYFGEMQRQMKVIVQMYCVVCVEGEEEGGRLLILHVLGASVSVCFAAFHLHHKTEQQNGRQGSLKLWD